jgi:hypothetical protein
MAIFTSLVADSPYLSLSGENYWEDVKDASEIDMVCEGYLFFGIAYASGNRDAGKFIAGGA